MNNPCGWLPFGSTDASVIFKADLKSAASITANACTVAANGTGSPTFSATLGMNPNGTAGYTLTGITNAALLDNSGQMTVEVQKEWLCYNDPTNGSSGDVLSAAQFLVSMLATAGGAIYLFNKTAGGSILPYISGAGTVYAATDMVLGGTALNAYVNSSGKPDFIKVNVGWWGGKAGGVILFAIDDQLIGYQVLSGTAKNGLFANVYLGSDRAIAGSFPSRYMRNLQISSQPPMFPVHPMLTSVSVLSDSMFNTDSLDSAYRDAMSSHQFRKFFMKKGFRVGAMSVHINGGKSITNDFGPYVAAQIAPDKPTVVLYRGGTNDVIQSLAVAGVDAAMKTQLTEIMAIPSVQKCVVGTIPSTLASSGSGTHTDAMHTATLEANENIKLLPAWWEAQKVLDTAKKGTIYVADVYTDVGAENPESNTFIGQLTGLYTNLHFAGIGLVKMGDSYARALVTG